MKWFSIIVLSLAVVFIAYGMTSAHDATRDEPEEEYLDEGEIEPYENYEDEQFEDFEDGVPFEDEESGQYEEDEFEYYEEDEFDEYESEDEGHMDFERFDNGHRRLSSQEFEELHSRERHGSRNRDHAYRSYRRPSYRHNYTYPQYYRRHERRYDYDHHDCH